MKVKKTLKLNSEIKHLILQQTLSFLLDSIVYEDS